MDRKQIELEMLVHEAKMKALKEGRALTAQGVGHTTESEAPATAWDWSPDPRATADLQKPTHDFGGDRPDAPAPHGPEHGIDR